MERRAKLKGPILRELASAEQRASIVDLGQHCDSMEIDEVIHVPPRHEVGFNDRQPISTDSEMAVFRETDRSKESLDVKASNLYTCEEFISEEIVEAIYIELAADDLMERGELDAPRHNVKESLKARGAEEF